jgi:glycosyltransferase involved in cell wall biosynthesis
MTDDEDDIAGRRRERDAPPSGLERVNDAPRFQDELMQSLEDIRASVERLHRRHDLMERQLSELRDHSNLVGYLVEQLITRKRSPLIPAGAIAWLRRLAAPFVRTLVVFARPRASWRAIRSASQGGRKAATRAQWSEGAGRWRQTVDRGVWSRSVWRGAKGLFVERRAPSYRIRQRLPTARGARPRILHAIPNVFVGGSTQLIVDLLDHLGHKYEMQVMTSAFPPGTRHEGMIIHDLREPTTEQSIYDLLTKFQPDIVHVSYWGDVDSPWYEKVFAAATRFGCIIVENVNTPVHPYRHQSIAKYIYVSDYVRREFGSDSPEEVVIHPGIDLERFAPRRTVDTDAENSIGMVYRLEPDKLNLESIDPLILAVKARPRTRAIVVGDGSLYEPFLRRVTAAGVRDNFVFTGYVSYSDLPAYYAMFRIFVAPVWKESFGQVTPFAMNMGMAVAGNNIGALSEILGYEDTLGSAVEETARKIVELLEDPARAEHYGERNRERARSHFSVETMCRAYDRLYENALGLSSDLMPGFPEAQLFPA